MPVISRIEKHCDDDGRPLRDELTIHFTDGTFIKLKAETSEYSLAWLEEYPLTQFSQCCGRNLIKVTATNEEDCCANFMLMLNWNGIEINSANDNTICYLEFEQGRPFKFLLRCSHNGYYSASLVVQNQHNLIPKKQYPPKSIIFVIGLPGSGKSAFCRRLIRKKKQFEGKECILKDDHDQWIFVTSWNNEDFATCTIESSMNKIDANHPVIFCNAKLCNASLYTRMIEEVLRVDNPETAIVTYCFDKNVERSIANGRRRITNSKYTTAANIENKTTKLLNSINRLAAVYDPQNAAYYNRRMLTTFSNVAV